MIYRQPETGSAAECWGCCTTTATTTTIFGQLKWPTILELMQVWLSPQNLLALL